MDRISLTVSEKWFKNVDAGSHMPAYTIKAILIPLNEMYSHITYCFFDDALLDCGKMSLHMDTSRETFSPSMHSEHLLTG